MHVTAFRWRRLRFPGLATPGNFLVRHIQVQTTLGYIEFDDVSILHQRQCTADGRLGSDMQDHSAKSGATHPAVGDANHIGDTLLCYFLRDVEIAYFGHARVSFRPYLLEDEDTALIDIKRRIIDAFMVVFNVCKDDRSPSVCHQMGCRRRWFDDCAIFTEISAQHSNPRGLLKGLVFGGNNLPMVTVGVPEV